MHNHRPASSGQVQPVVAFVVGAIAAAGIVAAVILSGPSGTPTASVPPPIASPSPAAPSGTPFATPAPSVGPTAIPTPSPTPPSGPPESIDLKNATNHHVVLQIHDQTGTLDGAESGAPGDGMSVRWHDAAVGQIDDSTISVTWVGLPGDEVADLGVAIVDGRLTVTIVQSGPVANSDAMGEDRIVILFFDGPVAAGDVGTQVLDRTID